MRSTPPWWRRPWKPFAANNDADTRVVIFRGEGRAFCAGDDLTTHTNDRTHQEERILVDRIQAITREIVLGNQNARASRG